MDIDGDKKKKDGLASTSEIMCMNQQERESIN